MRTNTKPRFTEQTHEGAPAARMNTEQALRRSVLSCLLWEDEFYEDGVSIAERIFNLAMQVPPETVAKLAVEVRTAFNLRHAPLMLLKALVKSGHGKGKLVSDAIRDTIQRADELAEFLAIYWKDGKKPLSNPMRKGLAQAFLKFNAYQLAKYDRPGVVKLRDALFLSHAKPDSPERDGMWKQLIAGTLPAPDTWESALVGGKDKKETFERLLREGSLGYFALLRNLRGMTDAGVDPGLIRSAIVARKGGADRVLPFRFIAAARACPQLEPEVDQALCEGIAALPPLEGRTIVLVDVSGSMDDRLSGRSDLKRVDAAAALASVINGDVRVFSFSNHTVEVPPRRGMAGVDAIQKSQDHSGTYLGKAVSDVSRLPHDRLIVVTDEQSHDAVPAPVGKGYMLNVASAKNGVGYGNWVHVDGFSEGVIRFIHELERQNDR